MEYRSVYSFNHLSYRLYRTLSLSAFHGRTQLDQNISIAICYMFFHPLHQSLFISRLIPFDLFCRFCFRRRGCNTQLCNLAIQLQPLYEIIRTIRTRWYYFTNALKMPFINHIYRCNSTKISLFLMRPLKLFSKMFYGVTIATFLPYPAMMNTNFLGQVQCSSQSKLNLKFLELSKKNDGRLYLQNRRIHFLPNDNIY